MISLEKARKLKELGLKWEPKPRDDMFIVDEQRTDSVVCVADNSFTVIRDHIHHDPPRHFSDIEEFYVWLLSLSQLLAEIAGRDWRFKLSYSPAGVKCLMYISKAIRDENMSVQEYEHHMNFVAPTPEDAAASALLWILEQEASQ